MTPTTTRRALGPFDVEVWEWGSASPLVFFHGYERHPGAASFLERLAERHRVIAPEQPGYGRSEGFEHVEDIFDLVFFYRRLVRSLAGAPVDLVGHSTGAMMAAELAIVAPELVRRLVVVDPFGLWLDEEPCQDPFGAPGDVAAAKWFSPADKPDPEPSNFVPDPADAQWPVLYQAQNYATATKFMWPMAERGLCRRLQYLEVPTLVVSGEADGLVPPSYARRFAELVEGAQLTIIERAGHYPMIEREDAFLEAVEAFLAG